MKVKATRIGFDGLCRRKEGTVFDWADDRELASWVEPAEEGDRVKAAKAEQKRAQERAEHARTKREQIGSTSPVKDDGKPNDPGSAKDAEKDSKGK